MVSTRPRAPTTSSTSTSKVSKPDCRPGPSDPAPPPAGFSKIQNLEAYTKVKSIWLESNGIEEISGLDHMKGLRMM